MGERLQTERTVHVQILEQPSPKSLRFRYECEGRSTGALTGLNSTNEKKTFPKIQIVGYAGHRAVVVVSCVTVEPPYRPHPHNLVGKDGFCKKGVCTMEIVSEDMTCEFPNLGIQCVKKKDIEESLKVRKEIRVDPFRTGFDHATQNSGSGIDLNALRLCFQVFLEGPETGEFKVPVKSVVSDPIFDKKSVNDLTVVKLSDCTSPVIGNKEIILLCDKISKDDVEVRFYEEAADGHVVWESFGNFQPSVDVHKQYAISFRTPQYRDLEIPNPVRVFIQLRCPSKGTTSAPRPFEYIPLCSGRKRLWNLTSFSKCNMSESMTSSSMIKSHDSAISEPPKKVTKQLALEDLLVAEGAEDSVYNELNEAVSGAFSKSMDLDFNMLIGNDIGDADVLVLENGEIPLGMEMLLTDDGVPEGEVADTAEGIDPIYGSFILAMRNPIDFENETGASALDSFLPPPRPPKLMNGSNMVVVEPPPLPPRRSKAEKKQNGGFLSKIFGSGGKGAVKSPSKSSTVQASSKSPGNLNTNNNGKPLDEGLLTFEHSLRAADGSIHVSTEDTPLSPTTSLLKSLIKDEQNEHLSKQNNNESTVDLNDIDVENYALLYVDTSAPRATSSEFDEGSTYYMDSASSDLVNNN